LFSSKNTIPAVAQQFGVYCIRLKKPKTSKMLDHTDPNIVYYGESVGLGSDSYIGMAKRLREAMRSIIGQASNNRDKFNRQLISNGLPIDLASYEVWVKPHPVGVTDRTSSLKREQMILDEFKAANGRLPICNTGGKYV
jgi:hypothetical protein